MKEYCLKYVLAFCFFCSVYSYATGVNNYRLPQEITLDSQVVNLELDPSKPTFSGTTILSLEISSPTDTISYHSHDLNIQSVELLTDELSTNLPVETANNYDIVKHKLDHKVSGQAKLVIKFIGKFSSHGQGLFVQASGAEADYIFSQFQPMLARRVFPSLNEPDKKTSFQFTLTIPSYLTALHNTRALSTKIDSNKKTIKFEKTAVIPTDVLAIAVGTFDSKKMEETKYKSTLFSPQGLQYQYHEELPLLINNTIDYLSGYLGKPFPYDKLDFFIAPFDSSAAMENVGLIALSPKEIPSALASSYDMCVFRKLVAHEIAHMWFGNDITMQWYDDYWMNESFSEFFAAKIVTHFYPTEAQCTYTPQSSSLESDNDMHRAVITEVKVASEQDGTGQLVYSKGFSILAMLEQAMGEDEFKESIREYVKTFQGTVMSFDSFKRYIPKNLVGVASSFLQQSSYPSVTLYRKDDALYLKQDNFFRQNKLWSIPLTLKIYNVGNEVSYKNVLLNTQTMLLSEVSPSSQIFIDTKGVGYFRYIDKTDNAEFPLHLLSDAEKLSYMENNDALASAALIDYMDYVDTLVLTLNSLPTDSVESLKALNSLIDSFIEFVPSDLKAPYSSYLQANLPKIIDWQTVFNKENGGAWLSFYGVYLKSESAIAFAKGKIKQGKVIDLSARSSVLKVAAANSTDIEYSELLALFNHGDITFKEDVLDSIGYTLKEEQIEAFYELLLSDLTTEFVIDYRFQFPAFFAENREFVAAYFSKNKDRILKRIPKEGAQWVVYNFMTACSSAESKLIQDTFEEWKNIDGLSSKLEVILNKVEECARSSKAKVKNLEQRIYGKA